MPPVLSKFRIITRIQSSADGEASQQQLEFVQTDQRQVPLLQQQKTSQISFDTILLDEVY
jgi:hypothetical protein